METKKIYTQHEENIDWMNRVLFYYDELKIMQKRLSEIASKNTSKDLLANVEHFQNQMIVQKNNLDELKHAINISNDEISREIKNNTTAVDHRSMKDHSEIRESIASFEKNFTSLKGEFNTLISKWM